MNKKMFGRHSVSYKERQRVGMVKAININQSIKSLYLTRGKGEWDGYEGPKRASR
jgi:hypothetical protein